MEKDKEFQKIFFKIEGLGKDTAGYNYSGLMDWLDESNNLIFYTYITTEDLKYLKKGSIDQLLVANFYDLEEAKYCMQKAGGIPSELFIKIDERRSFYQDNIALSIVKKIDKFYADFLIKDSWKLFSHNFTKIKIIKKKFFNKNKIIRSKIKKI